MTAKIARERLRSVFLLLGFSPRKMREVSSAGSHKIKGRFLTAVTFQMAGTPRKTQKNRDLPARSTLAQLTRKKSGNGPPSTHQHFHLTFITIAFPHSPDHNIKLLTHPPHPLVNDPTAHTLLLTLRKTDDIVKDAEKQIALETFDIESSRAFLQEQRILHSTTPL